MVFDETAFTKASVGPPPKQSRWRGRTRLAMLAGVVVACAVSIILIRDYLRDSQDWDRQQRLVWYNRSLEQPYKKSVYVTIFNEDEIALNGTGTLQVKIFPTRGFLRALHFRHEPGDDTFLKLRVTAPTFSVDPTLDEIQTTASKALNYSWILTAKQSGNQFVYVRGVAYRRTASGKIQDRVTFTNAVRVINVTTPVAPLSLANWVTLATTALGSGGLLALLELLRTHSHPERARA